MATVFADEMKMRKLDGHVFLEQPITNRFKLGLTKETRDNDGQRMYFMDLSRGVLSEDLWETYTMLSDADFIRNMGFLTVEDGASASRKEADDRIAELCVDVFRNLCDQFLVWEHEFVWGLPHYFNLLLTDNADEKKMVPCTMLFQFVREQGIP